MGTHPVSRTRGKAAALGAQERRDGAVPQGLSAAHATDAGDGRARPSVVALREAYSLPHKVRQVSDGFSSTYSIALDKFGIGLSPFRE